MKKFQFLLLDAGPIIKLFELGLWDKFIENCEVTISNTVASEAKHICTEDPAFRIQIDILKYVENKKIQIVDSDASELLSFTKLFDSSYSETIHDGEKEILAYLHKSKASWLLCSADGSVFRTLGLLGRSEQGISLEEILNNIGLSRQLEWKYKQKFRLKYTQMGQQDAVIGKGLKNLISTTR